MESLKSHSALQVGCLGLALILLVALLYFIFYGENTNAMWAGVGLLAAGGIYAWDTMEKKGGRSHYHFGGYGGSSSSSSSEGGDFEGGAAKKAKKKAKKAAKKAVKKAAKKAAKKKN